ncbi:MAG: DNA repair protein RecO [Eubacteriales bacterium]
MNQKIKVKGIVLSSMPIGDYDKRIVLITKEGKLNAFAKGSRRPNSHLLAGSQTFVIGDFVIYKGKNSNSINQIEIIKSFYELRQDIEKMAYGLYFNEFVAYITDENIESSNIISLLAKSLHMLTKEIISNTLIRCIFELKILSLSGLTPEIINCLIPNCNSNHNEYYFVVSEGGIMCKNHGKLNKKGIKITEGTRYTMQYILAAPINKLFSFNVSNKILMELNFVLKEYLKYHFDFKFKSLEFIDNLY